MPFLTLRSGAAMVFRQFSLRDPIPELHHLQCFLQKSGLSRLVIARAAVILAVMRPYHLLSITQYLYSHAGGTPYVFPVAALAVAAERSGEGQDDPYWTYVLGEWSLFVAQNPTPLPSMTLGIDMGMHTFSHINQSQLAAFAIAKGALMVEINRRADISLQVDSDDAAEEMARYIEEMDAQAGNWFEQELEAAVAAGTEREIMDGPSPTA